MTPLFKQIIILSLSAYFVGCNPTKEKAIYEKLHTESSQKNDTTNDNRYKKLKLQLQNSDSILLVSHEQTYDLVFDKKHNSYKEAKRLVEDNIINKKVIKKTVLIEGKERETLISFLTQKVKEEQIDLAHCFDPQHALIVISKGQIGYIEFCFTCGGVSADKVDISSEDFDKEKWGKIYKFIDSKIPFKE